MLVLTEYVPLGFRPADLTQAALQQLSAADAHWGTYPHYNPYLSAGPGATGFGAPSVTYSLDGGNAVAAATSLAANVVSSSLTDAGGMTIHSCKPDFFTFIHLGRIHLCTSRARCLPKD